MVNQEKEVASKKERKPKGRKTAKEVQTGTKKDGPRHEVSSGIDKKKKKHRHPNNDSYKSYIYKVLKKVHPTLGISSKSMSILDTFVIDTLEKIAREASRLSKFNKRQTITAREIQTAVRLIIPGELCKHAVSEGSKALNKFNATVQENKQNKKE